MISKELLAMKQAQRAAETPRVRDPADIETTDLLTGESKVIPTPVNIPEETPDKESIPNAEMSDEEIDQSLEELRKSGAMRPDTDQTKPDQQELYQMLVQEWKDMNDDQKERACDLNGEEDMSGFNKSPECVNFREFSEKKKVVSDMIAELKKKEDKERKSDLFERVSKRYQAKQKEWSGVK